MSVLRTILPEASGEHVQPKRIRSVRVRSTYSLHRGQQKWSRYSILALVPRTGISSGHARQHHAVYCPLIWLPERCASCSFDGIHQTAGNARKIREIFLSILNFSRKIEMHTNPGFQESLYHPGKTVPGVFGHGEKFFEEKPSKTDKRVHKISSHCLEKSLYWLILKSLLCNIFE